jgi:hypothetical protein
MNIPTCAVPVLTMFRPVFSTPTYHRLLVLALAAVLTTGRRTVTNLLRTVRAQAPGHVSSYRKCTPNSRPQVSFSKVETCYPLPSPVADRRLLAFDS